MNPHDVEWKDVGYTAGFSTRPWCRKCKLWLDEGLMRSPCMAAIYPHSIRHVPTDGQNILRPFCIRCLRLLVGDEEERNCPAHPDYNALKDAVWLANTIDESPVEEVK